MEDLSSYDGLAMHMFLSNQELLQLQCEVEPRWKARWRQLEGMLEELYLLEECLTQDADAEAVARVFPKKLELFSKLWRTAL